MAENEAEVEEKVEPTPEQVEAEAKQAEEVKVQEKEKAKRRLSDRNKEITYKLREAERQLEAERKVSAELKEAQKIKKEPQEDDFDDFSQFQEKKTQWSTQKEQEMRQEITQKVQQEQWQAQQQRQAQENQAAYLKNREAFAKDDDKFHDYEVAIDDAVNTWGAPEIQDLILKAKEHGPMMVKHLGTHPEELSLIASSSPQERPYLIGRLQAKLEAKPVKKVSSAPDPVRSGGGSAIAPVNPENESVSEYIRRKNFG